MSLTKPYEFITFGRMYYAFTTNNLIDYEVEFVKNSLDFDESLLVFEVTIATIESQNKILPPLDLRVELTIVEIIREFFSDNNKSVVFACDNRDNRHHSRKRKFDALYNKFKTKDIEKYDSEIKLDNSELLTTLLIHQNNPFKKIIIDLFLSQKDELDK